MEPVARVRARVAAHVCPCSAEGARPVAVRVRAPAAAWNGPTGHSQVQTRLVGETMALARRGVRPRVTVPARVAAQARVTGRTRVMTEARVTVPARIGGITVQARTKVLLRISGQPQITGQPRITAVRAIRAARFHRTAFSRTLALRMLICGPPAYGTVPPVRTPIPAAVRAVVAIGAPAGVVSGSTVRAEVGVTSSDGPTPARVPGRLRTAIAHATLTPPGPPPLPSRNHSIMKHQRRPRCLFGEAGPTGLPSGAGLSRAHQLRRSAARTGFPEREPR
jgi:hypothetical protein